MKKDQNKKERYFQIKKQSYQQILKFKKLTKNWFQFFKKSIQSNFIQSNLIWNEEVKNELSYKLFKEIQDFNHQVSSY